MFPLGSVLTRHQVLPLHIFEPRYRRLVGDCLEGDGRFGVVLIERGSEVGGGDVRSNVGTIATIVDAQALPDGRWAVVAVGGERVRVREWLDDDPYPRAVVEPWPDVPGTEHLAEVVGVGADRLRALLALASEMGVDDLRFDLDLDEDPVHAAAQLVAASPIGPLDRQRLLECAGPDERMSMLTVLLEEATEVLRAQMDGAGPGGRDDWPGGPGDLDQGPPDGGPLGPEE